MICAFSRGWIKILTITVTLASALGYCDEKPSLRVAALLPLSGSGADQGRRCQRGFQLAAQKLERTFNLRLQYDDTGGDPKRAVDSFRNLQSIEKLDAFFTWGSGVAMALSPLANAEHIPQIGVATGTPRYRSADDYTFRLYHSTEEEAQYAAKALTTEWPRGKGAILYIANEYGESFYTSLKRQLEVSGTPLAFEDSFLPGTTDFRSQLLKLKSLSPDYIIILGYPAEGLALLGQAATLGLKDTPFIIGGAMYDAALFSDPVALSFRRLSIVVERASDDLETGQAREAVRKEYEMLFHEPLAPHDFYVLRAYDALHTVATAALRCSRVSPECIKEQLYKIQKLPGTLSPVSFDRFGETESSLGFYSLSNGWQQHP